MSKNHSNNNEQELNEYYNHSNNSLREQGLSFDKAILTLSSGALGLSLTFLTQNLSKLFYYSLLYISWSFFIFSIILTIVSFFVHLGAIKSHLPLVVKYYRSDEQEFPDPEKNPYNKALYVMNWFAAISFIFGVTLSALFIAINLQGGRNVEKESFTDCEKENRKEKNCPRISSIISKKASNSCSEETKEN